MRCPNCSYDMYWPGRTCIRCGYALHVIRDEVRNYRDVCRWIDADLRYTPLMSQVIMKLVHMLLSSTTEKSNAAIRKRFNTLNNIWIRVCARYRMTAAKEDFLTYIERTHPKLNEALRGE